MREYINIVKLLSEAVERYYESQYMLITITDLPNGKFRVSSIDTYDDSEDYFEITQNKEEALKVAETMENGSYYKAVKERKDKFEKTVKDIIRASVGKNIWITADGNFHMLPRNARHDDQASLVFGKSERPHEVALDHGWIRLVVANFGKIFYVMMTSKASSEARKALTEIMSMCPIEEVDLETPNSLNQKFDAAKINRAISLIKTMK